MQPRSSGVLRGLPKHIMQDTVRAPNTPVNHRLQYIFLLGMVMVIFSTLAPVVEIITSSIGWTFSAISFPFVIITDYILSPVWNSVTYPIRWVFGYIPSIDMEDVSTDLKTALSGITARKKLKAKQPLDDHEANDNTAQLLTEEPDLSEAKLSNNNDAVRKGRKDITNNPEAIRIAYKHGRNTEIRRQKSIGAASLSPQEVATAHMQGREEVLKYHKSQGALEVNPREIAAAHDQGRNETLQLHISEGKHSLTTDEINGAFAKGRAKKIEEIFSNASKLTHELTGKIQANAVDASYISLLRNITIESGDPSIIDKAIFCTKLSECLRESHTVTECIDLTIRSVGITYHEEICP